MNQAILLATLMLGACLCSCTSSFTLKTHGKLQEQAIDLSAIQFYNSERIVLRRTVRKDENVHASSGTVSFEKGRLVETIVIKKRTPAVVEDAGENLIYVRFEKGTGRYLPFRLQHGRYYLDTRDGAPSEPTYVLYNGHEYNLRRGKVSYLALKRKDRFRAKTDRRVVRGVRLK